MHNNRVYCRTYSVQYLYMFLGVDYCILPFCIPHLCTRSYCGFSGTVIRIYNSQFGYICRQGLLFHHFLPFFNRDLFVQELYLLIPYESFMFQDLFWISNFYVHSLHCTVEVLVLVCYCRGNFELMGFCNPERKSQEC